MIVSSCYFLQHTYKHISKTLNVTVSKVFDEIPQPEKDFKEIQNRDDPGIIAWDHYKGHQKKIDVLENDYSPITFSPN